MQNDLSVIIPAAGIGKRMKSYGPKCCIEIGSESVIKRQIRIIEEIYGKIPITIVIGFIGNKIKRNLPKNSNIKFIFNKNYSATNVAQSIMLGLENINSKSTLILYSDLVFSKRLIEDIDIDKSTLIARELKDKKSEVGININNDNATHLSYGIYPSWSQIAILNKKEQYLFLKSMKNNNLAKRKYFTHEILNEVMELGGNFEVSITKENIIEIDSSSDILLAKKFVREDK